MFRTAAALALSACFIWAQTPPGSPTFEVASIKPAAPQEMGRMMMGMRGGPGTNDPGQVTFTNSPLRMLITVAFNVKNFQVTGPAWLDSERFDIKAKVPQGATKEQFQEMMQNLLADRFKMVVHKETKDAAVYELVPAKGGVKLKEAPKEPPADTNAPPPPPPPPGPPKMDKDGHLVMPKGAPKGAMMMMMGPKGMRLAANGITMGRLCDMLSNQLGRPVIDKTALTGEYDIALDFSPEGLPMMRGMPMMGPKPGDGGPDVPHEMESGPTLFSALQEQLGLKLDSNSKGKVDLIVVDSMEKAPTEN